MTKDRCTSLGENESGVLVPDAVRVPQDVPYRVPSVDPNETPGLAGTDICPTFDRRTVPLSPYGTFFVELFNRTSDRFVLSPKSLHLVARGFTYPAIADSGSVAGRWRCTLDAYDGHREDLHVIGPSMFDIHRELYLLDRPVTIEPGEAWRGPVVFDIDAFTSDEYEAFLLAAGQLNVQLLEGLTTRSRHTFPAKTGAIDAICLPETHHLDFVHCEVEVAGLPADR